MMENDNDLAVNLKYELNDVRGKLKWRVDV